MVIPVTPPLPPLPTLQAAYEEADWVRNTPSHHHHGEEDGEGSEEDEAEEEVFECVVCDKVFRSDKQLKNTQHHTHPR